MANIIAVIWDCDKTLVDGYMQDPIFEENGLNSTQFWDEVNAKPTELAKKGIRVNRPHSRHRKAEDYELCLWGSAPFGMKYQG